MSVSYWRNVYATLDGSQTVGSTPFLTRESAAEAMGDPRKVIAGCRGAFRVKVTPMRLALANEGRSA